MGSNRDKIQDNKITSNLILNKQYVKHKDPSWLDHFGKYSIIDYRLLIGSSLNKLIEASHSTENEVKYHLDHLCNDHGLNIANHEGIFSFEGMKISDEIVHDSSGNLEVDRVDLKIGQLVKLFVPKIINYIENVDSDELSKLKDFDFSKNTFNLNFSLIKKISEIPNFEIVRYWRKNYIINGQNFRFCSQWYAGSRILFLDYLEKVGIITLEEKKLYIPFEGASIVVPAKKIEKINKEVKSEPLGRQKIEVKGIDDKEYERHNELFDSVLRREAHGMSKHYETFYCLERTIRKIVQEAMEEKYGKDWWVKKVDPSIQDSVKKNIDWESDTVFSKRSNNKIDYTTFGQLRQIVKWNWHIFSGHFRSLNAFNRLMTDLNQLRVPIAHCTPLNKKEVRRLELTMDDWFDLFSV